MTEDLRDVKEDLARVADVDGDVLCRAALREIEELEAKLAKAESIVRILASAEWDDRLGEAVDLACAYLAEVDE